MISSNIGSVRSDRVGIPFDMIDPKFQVRALTRNCGHLALFGGYFLADVRVDFGLAGQTHQIGPNPNSESPTLTETDP